ncbi:MAG: transglycosylase domain-containing protein [Alphaproteobacteria bacterium]|nr:transglycosylase domain-containing protein [Alphaproteobacteria bacterium]
MTLHLPTLLRWLARVALGCALGFALLVVAVAASRASLRTPDPTLLLIDRHGAFLGEVGAEEDAPLGYWPVDPMPWRVVSATLALEDRRFWTHPGVDPRAVARAVSQNMKEGGVVSGASTLAMQVARMQDPGPRTYGRKAVEATTALMLTARYGREEVLRHYLRLVPYGNRIRGIGYAARRYLDKPVQDLSWAETAFLCALPQAPSRTNPFDPEGRKRAVSRAHRILDALHAEGLLDDAELELARVELEALRIPERGERPVTALHAVLRMEESLAAEPLDGPVLQGDPRVTLTLDLGMQEDLTAIVGRRVRGWAARGVGQAAVMVVDRATGEVLAAVSSVDYFDEQASGAIDYARVERLPGSTLKPFLYALALERGVLTPGTVLDDLGRGPEGIRNADNRYLGPMLPRVALGNSRNVPAVRLLDAIGVDAGYSLFRELGLHDDAEPASHYGLGLAIGGMPLTLEHLVQGYTALADDGRWRELAWVQGAPQAERQLFTPETARVVTGWLSDPLARLPSFSRMGFSEYPFPVAVKTGTSAQYRDAWAVAYSERYIVGAWVGHPDYLPMKQMSGFRAGARLVQEVMTHLHADELDGLTDLGFPSPEAAAPYRICALSGQRATDACDRVFTEHFTPGTEPVEDCPVHRRVWVDARNGLLASNATPERFRRERVFAALDPRYADWAERAHLPRAPETLSMLGDDDAPVMLSDLTPLTPTGRVALPGADTPPSLRVTAPSDGVKLIRDPEIPAPQATLALRAAVDPPVEQVVWYVDGEPFIVADYPYTARWPLTPGTHRIEARLPFTTLASEAVVVEVR